MSNDYNGSTDKEHNRRSVNTTCVKLRPHHLLCLAFFEGKGYSQDFVDNMTAVLDRLREQNALILTDSADDICRACPNLRQGACLDGHKVDRYDDFVQRKCALRFNTTYQYDTLSQSVRDSIIDKALLISCCGDCQWIDVCAKCAP